MDCDPSIEVDVDPNSLEKLCYKLLISTQTKDKAKDVIYMIRYYSDQYEAYSVDKNAEDCLKRLLAQEIKQLIQKELGTKGVFSLSAVWNSPLMWSHYADQHRGFCIEYDTTEAARPSIGALNYGSPRSVKASDLFEWKFRGSKEAEQRVHNTYFFSKAPQWRYEKEWRDIRDISGVAPTTFRVAAIYFGFRCDGAVVKSIVKLHHTEQTKNNVAFYKVYPQDDSFRLKKRRVDREEIQRFGLRTYTPFVPNEEQLALVDTFSPE